MAGAERVAGDLDDVAHKHVRHRRRRRGAVRRDGPRPREMHGERGQRAKRDDAAPAHNFAMKLAKAIEPSGQGRCPLATFMWPAAPASKNCAPRSAARSRAKSGSA